MIYFIADNHFFHSLASSNRGFDSSSEMDMFMIKRWNNKIKDTDDVYILGDFAFDPKGNKIAQLIQSLKGRLHLILGNHDLFVDRLSDTDTQNMFVEVCQYKEIKYNRIKFILFHYPIREWKFKKFGSIHLHGHQHTTVYEDENMLNVSADLIGFTPISIDDVLKRVNRPMLSE